MVERSHGGVKWLSLVCVAGLLVAGCGSGSRSASVESYQIRGQIIAITYLDNGCMNSERSLALEETDTQVIVDLQMRGSGKTCEAYAIQVTSEVPLMSPLKGRTVVDASTDAEIPEGKPTTG